MNKDITLEDLGYEKTIDANNLLVYEIKNSITDTDKLVFYKNLKNFEMYTQSDSPFETLHPQNITVKELQAIYNKCKELGWFDED